MYVTIFRHSRVRLLINRSSGEALAMKVIDLEKHPEAAENVRKEICVHRMLTNPNIIKCFGHRRETNSMFIFLEYSAGGELFDRIGRMQQLLICTDIHCL